MKCGLWVVADVVGPMLDNDVIDVWFEGILQRSLKQHFACTFRDWRSRLPKKNDRSVPSHIWRQIYNVRKYSLCFAIYINTRNLSNIFSISVNLPFLWFMGHRTVIFKKTCHQFSSLAHTFRDSVSTMHVFVRFNSAVNLYLDVQQIL